MKKKYKNAAIAPVLVSASIILLLSVLYRRQLIAVLLNADLEEGGFSTLRSTMKYIGSVLRWSFSFSLASLWWTSKAPGVASESTLAVTNGLDGCPGYNAVNVTQTRSGLKASLVLAGPACNVFGPDIPELLLEVSYEDISRLHVKITDPNDPLRYQVPDSVLPRPQSNNIDAVHSEIHFNLVSTHPFAFTVSRSPSSASSSSPEILFDTTSSPLIFEPQYWNIKSRLPPNPNIYGLGEHAETFRLPTVNLTRTLWSRDAYGIPAGTNLYGNHPIYFEHRTTGTHGVFLLNSNGMDIKLNTTKGGESTLEYNVIGGIIDFYFLAGSRTDPQEVARQYAQIVGTPAEVPYWSLGFHQCRFGYQNFIEVANVITNYSEANIPLETMWTDIDYMQARKTFTNDPQYFPTDKLREIVSYLHEHDQHYILMVDPAVAYQPNTGYGPVDRGLADDVFLKNSNGSLHLGVVWPGVTVFPDWFHPNTSAYWSNEFSILFNPETGIDIDGVWIDMNEPSNFCFYPCTDPFQQAIDQDMPPDRLTPPPDPNTPIFNEHSLTKRGLTDQQLLNPPYNISNAAGVLSERTAHVTVTHFNGLKEYDTHNLYGTMMSVVTQQAMSHRRPGLRTLVITRSTFAGAGHHVGKWLGDNLSDWVHYRNSIAGMLGMATVYQVPMVGSDVCGFGLDTTDLLCARWAMLGAFNPFYRNHNQDNAIAQEFYRWPVVAQAARNAIDTRYRLLDYIYTAFHRAHQDGTPILQPLWFQFPKDEATYGLDLQFLYGDSILVSPVSEENATSVEIYLPKEQVYDFHTFAPVPAADQGKTIRLDNVSFTQLPTHIIGGSIIPLRSTSANTTTQLRERGFHFVVAPNMQGTASGSLYLDDGVSVVQKRTSEIEMTFSAQKGELVVKGTFDFEPAPVVEMVTVLNVVKKPGKVTVQGEEMKTTYDEVNKALTVQLSGRTLNAGFELQLN